MPSKGNMHKVKHGLETQKRRNAETQGKALIIINHTCNSLTNNMIHTLQELFPMAYFQYPAALQQVQGTTSGVFV